MNKNRIKLLTSGLILGGMSSLFACGVAADNLMAGEQQYNQCIGCHSFSYHRTGPMHCNLFGREAGSAPGFDYSEAMQVSNIVWDTQTLDAFLASPFNSIPGTSMGFVGIADKGKRQDLIAYIEYQSHSEECAPNNDKASTTE